MERERKRVERSGSRRLRSGRGAGEAELVEVGGIGLSEGTLAGREGKRCELM